MLSLLSLMTTAAVDWRVIDQRPAEFKRLKVFDDYEALVSAAAKCDRRTLLMVS